MAQDWRDALKSLMPEDESPIPLEETESPSLDSTPLPSLRIDLDKRKGGKLATIISGFDPDDDRCQLLAAVLKKRLATGGSTRDGEILIQGDRITQCANIIKELGYKLKNKC